MSIPDFLAKTVTVLEALYADPALLKKKCPEVLQRLSKQGDEESQGSGNKVTDQEAAFASLLETHGFVNLPKKKKNDHLSRLPETGFFYIYQVNGTQQALDFQIFVVSNKTILKAFTFDLKHTKDKTIYLNDGWFETDVIYVISWSPKKGENSVFLGLGQNIPSKEETETIQAARKIKDEMNEKFSKVGALHIYGRFANRYECSSFVNEKRSQHFESLRKWILV